MIFVKIIFSYKKFIKKSENLLYLYSQNHIFVKYPHFYLFFLLNNFQLFFFKENLEQVIKFKIFI